MEQQTTLGNFQNPFDISSKSSISSSLAVSNLNQEAEKKHCKCGCMQEIIIKPHHKYYGIPYYILGHNNPYWKGKIGWSKGLTKESDKRIKGRLKGNNHPFFGKHWNFNDIIKQKIRKASLDHWQNPKYAEKVTKNALKGLCIKPNKPENILIDLFKKYNLPFHYVGDGQLIIGGKCPDFVCNPSKKVILLHGEYWHYLRLKKKNPEITKEEIEKKDIEHYKQNFFDCLIIWEFELKNLDRVSNKIKKFVGEVNAIWNTY